VEVNIWKLAIYNAAHRSQLTGRNFGR